MTLPHIKQLSPPEASIYGLVIYHNTAVNHLFIGCVRTATCVYDTAHVMQVSTNEYVHKCIGCEWFYTTKVKGLSHIYGNPRSGRPLDRWVAGWLGQDTDNVDVHVFEPVMRSSLPF
jgi:hypothetical protein